MGTIELEICMSLFKLGFTAALGLWPEEGGSGWVMSCSYEQATIFLSLDLIKVMISLKPQSSKTMFVLARSFWL